MDVETMSCAYLTVTKVFKSSLEVTLLYSTVTLNVNTNKIYKILCSKKWKHLKNVRDTYVFKTFLIRLLIKLSCDVRTETTFTISIGSSKVDSK